jgi:hypothetical protein
VLINGDGVSPAGSKPSPKTITLNQSSFCNLAAETNALDEPVLAASDAAGAVVVPALPNNDALLPSNALLAIKPAHADAGPIQAATSVHAATRDHVCGERILQFSD